MIIEDGVLYSIEESDLVNGELRIPKEVKYFSRDATANIRKSEKFKSLTFEEGSLIDNIDYWMFCGSSQLESVDLSNCKNLQGVEGNAFKNCGELKSIDLSNCESLTFIGTNAFNGCKNLEEVDLTDCHRLRQLGNSAFSGCEKLKSIKLDYCESLAEIGTQCFMDCRELEEVSGFSELKSLNVIGDRSFAFTGLKEITFPKTEEAGIHILGNAFFCCKNLERVIGEDCYIAEICGNVFEWCENLKDLSFNGAKILFLADRSFLFCDSLETIDLRGVNGVRRFEWSCMQAKEVLVSNRANWLDSKSYKDVFFKGTKISVYNSKGEVSKRFTIGDGNAYEGVKMGINRLVTQLEARGVKMDFRALNGLYSDREADLFLDSKNIKQYEDMMRACCGEGRHNENLVKFIRSLGYFGFEDTKTGSVDYQKVSEYKRLLARNFVQSKIKKDIRADINKGYIDKIVNEKSMEVARTHSLNDLVYSFVINNIASSEYKSNLFDALECVRWSRNKNVELAQFIVSNFDEIMDKTVVGKNWMEYRISGRYSVNTKGEYEEFYTERPVGFDAIFKNFSKVLTSSNKKVITRSDKNRLTINDFRDSAQYKGITEENKELAEYCSKMHVNQRGFDFLSELLKEGRAVKDEQVLKVCEDEVARGKDLLDERNADLITYKVLEKGDPLGLVLGDITNCCQKYGGAGQDCVIIGATNVNSTFMTINKGNKILAQGWIWYDSKTQTVAIDNIEVPEVMYNIVNKEKGDEVKECIQRFCDNAFRTMNENGYEVKNVIIGKSRTDLESLSANYERVTEMAKLIDCPFTMMRDGIEEDVYTDILKSGQYIVYKDGKRVYKDHSKQNDMTSEMEMC